MGRIAHGDRHAKTALAVVGGAELARRTGLVLVGHARQAAHLEKTEPALATILVLLAVGDADVVDAGLVLGAVGSPIANPRLAVATHGGEGRPTPRQNPNGDSIAVVAVD